MVKAGWKTLAKRDEYGIGAETVLASRLAGISSVIAGRGSSLKESVKKAVPLGVYPPYGAPAIVEYGRNGSYLRNVENASDLEKNAGRLAYAYLVESHSGRKSVIVTELFGALALRPLKDAGTRNDPYANPSSVKNPGNGLAAVLADPRIALIWAGMPIDDIKKVFSRDSDIKAVSYELGRKYGAYYPFYSESRYLDTTKAMSRGGILLEDRERMRDSAVKSASAAIESLMSSWRAGRVGYFDGSPANAPTASLALASVEMSGSAKPDILRDIDAAFGVTGFEGGGEAKPLIWGALKRALDTPKDRHLPSIVSKTAEWTKEMLEIGEELVKKVKSKVDPGRIEPIGGGDAYYAFVAGIVADLVMYRAKAGDVGMGMSFSKSGGRRTVNPAGMLKRDGRVGIVDAAVMSAFGLVGIRENGRGGVSPIMFRQGGTIRTAEGVDFSSEDASGIAGMSFSRKAKRAVYDLIRAANSRKPDAAEIESRGAKLLSMIKDVSASVTIVSTPEYRAISRGGPDAIIEKKEKDVHRPRGCAPGADIVGS